MVEFVQDDDRLREERKKAKKNKDKYIGVSSDSMGGGGGSSFKNCTYIRVYMTACLYLYHNTVPPAEHKKNILYSSCKNMSICG